MATTPSKSDLEAKKASLQDTEKELRAQKQVLETMKKKTAQYRAQLDVVHALQDAVSNDKLMLESMVELRMKMSAEQKEELIRLKDPERKVFFVYGGVNADEREEIRAITEKSDSAIIVASYGTFSTGINIRNLHNIVFSSPSKSRIRNLQSIGRGLRLGDNKTNATLYDIADDVSYGEKENYTLQHFRERINIYNEESFDYEIHNVELKE